MKIKASHIVLSIPFLLISIAIIVLAANSSGKEEIIITGIVESTQIDVASKLPGRVDSVLVNEGDNVTKGQVLAYLESKEMDAKLAQARSLMEAAKSKMDMARNGARPEEREAVEKVYYQSQHQFQLAEKTWKRIQSLYADQIISTQERDQVEFQYKAAREQMDAAKSKYEMVRKGTRYEEIQGAEALFHQAENGLKEAQAFHQELRLIAPISGEINKKITDPGEIVASGYPLFTIVDLSDTWVILQVREDQLSGIRKGNIYRASVPALGNSTFDFKVTYISAMADFATWRATNQKGDFDLKTFEIHLKSTEPIEGLRPGMTVNVKI